MSAPFRFPLWRQFLHEQHAAFSSLDKELANPIQDENSFRIEFETLCRRIHERYHAALLVNLNLGPINNLATAIDDAYQHPAPSGIVTLVFSSIFAIIKVSALSFSISPLSPSRHATPSPGWCNIMS